MRKDAIGLFWQDIPDEKGRVSLRKMPKIPKTKWKPPREFPRLSEAKIIALDTETYDPNLKTHGPGWARNDGHIVGISVAVSEKDFWYFPMRHTVKSKLNLDPDKVLAWAKDNLTGPQLKIGANIIYDIGWLRQEGVQVPGPYLDILHAEALIDENKFRYDLDTTAQQYLKVGKETNILYRWLAQYYGGKATPDQRKNIYRAPPQLVGPYAEADAWLPYLIWKKQKKILKKENLMEVFDLECRLIPMLLDMRWQGVRVDLDAATEARDLLLDEENRLLEKLYKIVGQPVDIYASRSIAQAFEKEGLEYPLTAKGNPSFTQIFLSNHPSKLANLITQARQLNKTRTTFIEGYILDKHVNGKLHCEFKQLKGEAGGGTVSGRLSSANPNLQNIPSRNPRLGKIVRRCFLPLEGYPHWWRGDSSQIEYRFLAHFAVGEGAKTIRKTYRKDPLTDYHEATRQQIHRIAKMLLDRKPTKTVNFGLVYGMGKSKLIYSLGLSRKKGNELFKAYHAGVPFVKETFEYYMGKAQREGVITTILGRRSRFNQYEESWNGDKIANSYKEACRLWGPGNFQRAFCHKALNRLLQGSAADHLKKAMVETYEAGIYDILGNVPSLTVHDELDGSFDYHNKDHIRALKEAKRIMENCLKVKVPLLMDFEYGHNWADCIDLKL